jgi:cell division protein FtsX
MIFKNFLRLFRINWFQTIATVLLLSFLIFFLNILIALTVNVYTFSNQLKDKLWVYLYFKEWDTKDEASKTYELIIDMKTRLEQAWLKVKYLSKEDAIKTLSKRLPKIIQNFEKYWIKNPIPPTMYIIFKSQQEYEKMRQIVLDKKYEDILLNLSDIWTTNSFKKQEERIKKIIEFSNFMISFYIFLSVVLFVIILWFLVLIIKLNFYSFYDQIEVEKLIWFSYFQIKLPFLLYTLFIVLFSFVLWLMYMYILLNYLDVYFMNVFNMDLWEIIKTNIAYLEKWLALEIASLLVVSLLVSNLFLTRLIKKI